MISHISSHTLLPSLIMRSSLYSIQSTRSININTIQSNKSCTTYKSSNPHHIQHTYLSSNIRYFSSSSYNSFYHPTNQSSSGPSFSSFNSPSHVPQYAAGAHNFGVVIVPQQKAYGMLCRYTIIEV